MTATCARRRTSDTPQAPQPRPQAAWPDDGWFAGVLDGGIPPLPPGFDRAGAGLSAYG
jgi:hypothetical protein